VAYETLQAATKSVTEVLNPVIKQFAEAEKLARQIAMMAQQKGLIDPATQATLTREQIKKIWDVISKDPDLSSSAFLLKAAVGLRDALILFDRVLVP
jgi:DNA-binding phage protein